MEYAILVFISHYIAFLTFLLATPGIARDLLLIQ